MKKWFALSFAFLLILVTAMPAVASGNDQARHRVLQNLVKNDAMKARILWVDLAANLFALDTQEEVRDMVEKAAKAHFDTLILDVKNYTGYVAYPSHIAPHISTSRIDKYQGYPKDYDLLSNVLKEAHKRGIKVHAAINVFSEGNNDYKDGPAFEHPEWQSVFQRAVRKVKAPDGSTYDLAGVNTERGTNQLVLYTPEKYKVSPANQWGAEAQVVNGVVTQVVDRVHGEPPLEIPENGVVLSGHGEAREWILAHLKAGDTVDMDVVETKLVPASEYPSSSVFVNPIRADVQEYELDIIREILDNYDVDGIVLDRARYANVYADFSNLSRKKFEEYIGEKVKNWPEDIFSVTFAGGEEKIVPGPLYQKWIEWRAGNIRDFFRKAERLVHEKDPSLFFSTYVGAWYPLYYSEGVNWASKTYQPDYDWASPDYHKTGYAEMLDFLMTGNYFSEVTREEAEEKGNPDWYSVEGSADIAMDVVNEATFVYGSLYLLQYKDRPEQFKRALEMALSKTHGIMLFDLIYLEEYNWWPIVEKAFAKPARPPHENPGLRKLISGD